MSKQFSIVPTLLKGIGYKTMIQCIACGYDYYNYAQHARKIPTVVVGQEAYHLAEELYRAETTFYSED